jgi:hypothetical protein
VFDETSGDTQVAFISQDDWTGRVSKSGLQRIERDTMRARTTIRFSARCPAILFQGGEPARMHAKVSVGVRWNSAVL